MQKLCNHCKQKMASVQLAFVESGKIMEGVPVIPTTLEYCKNEHCRFYGCYQVPYGLAEALPTPEADNQ